MRDLMKWNVALARLSDFIERFPACPNEEHVLRYHAIIGLFEEASGDVLSQFRIAPDRLTPRINDASASYWRSLYPLEFVEYAYFSRLVGGLIGYATHDFN
jgi:hypothetical protein